MNIEGGNTDRSRESREAGLFDRLIQALRWGSKEVAPHDPGAIDKAPDTAIQLATLSYFAKITSISQLDQLIRVVIEETPRLVNAAGCSIYLIPELVPQYDGTLIDHKFKRIKESRVKRDFIVLAANSRPNTEALIGRAFYPTGYGLSGWVFEHGKALRLEDMSDEQALHAIDPRLFWADRYGGSKDYYMEGDKKPVLIVPLIADGRTIGILKFLATLDKQPFSYESEQIATVVAQTVASIIRWTWMIEEQGRTIHHLVEIGAKEKPQEVFEAVTEHLAEMLSCRRCQLYLRGDDGSFVRLVVENGKAISPERAVAYKSGQSLVGWVFKTGRPLLIDDIREYSEKRYLDDRQLERISDGASINEEDRFLRWEQVHYPQHLESSLPFLAVPVKASDGSVQGVLCARCGGSKGQRQTTLLSRAELQMVQSFASTISLALENARAECLGNLLIRLGYDWDPAELFDLVIQQVPKLVPGKGCCIFILEPGSKGSCLQLACTSWEGLVTEKGAPAEIVYEVGEGKTGFCALAKATLVVNHYGSGKVARQAMETEKRRVQSDYKRDLIADIYDANGRQVGLIQIRKGAQISKEAKNKFKILAKSLVIRDVKGLPTPKLDEYARLGSRPSWSFVAVPIKHESGDLYGVMTMGRPVEGNPFSPEDVSLLESIAGRLAAVMSNLKMVEQREKLYVTLAHEINTPLTGILADTENIMDELAADLELKKLSKHNVEQVLRLQMLTETILAVMSGTAPEREFSIHSIYRPVKSACGLFESEAEQKGLTIRGPHAVGGDFPEIEMSLFDLTIAFKNLVHNAIKYSFRPSPGQPRWVEITGCWAGQERYSISIESYGVGIAREEIEKRLIFEPYYRGERSSDRRRSGAGLGLAYARQIVEDLHYGSIEVTSEPMPGQAEPYLTTFTVTLPVRQPRSDK